MLLANCVNQSQAVGGLHLAHDKMYNLEKPRKKVWFRFPDDGQPYGVCCLFPNKRNKIKRLTCDTYI